MVQQSHFWVATPGELKAALFAAAKRWEQPVSIDGWTHKQTVVDTFNGIIFDHKKEGNFDSCYRIDEPALC